MRLEDRGQRPVSGGPGPTSLGRVRRSERGRLNPERLGQEVGDVLSDAPRALDEGNRVEADPRLDGKGNLGETPAFAKAAQGATDCELVWIHAPA
jgi:hypothetical protein